METVTLNDPCPTAYLFVLCALSDVRVLNLDRWGDLKG